MLTVMVLGTEAFDEETSSFVEVGEDFELKLEHSLLSLSKWESKFEKPFLGKDTKTTEEILWYVLAMICNESFPSDLLQRLTQDNLSQINEYIESKQTATTFGHMPEARTGRKVETITSELIYYWMVTFNIPFDVETWHLNRLFSLIRICNMKQSKPKKMSPREIAQRNRDLNAQRRAEHNTSG